MKGDDGCSVIALLEIVPLRLKHCLDNAAFLLYHCK